MNCNKLIENYIEEAGLKLFKKEYLTDYIVRLTDINGSYIDLLNLFEDIIIFINDKEYQTVTKKKSLSGEFVWIIKSLRKVEEE